MSYHMVSNDTTTVELMPFTALEEEAEDYAYRSSSASGGSFSSRMPSLWPTSSSPSTNGRFFFFGDAWQDFCDGCIRRWQLLSRRRQKKLQIAFVLGGVLLIVLVLELGVKTIYHNHVKPKVDIGDDWDQIINEDDHHHYYYNNNENDQENDDGNTKRIIYAYDIPVNRVLCEQVIPLFKILDESLDHYCFQRNKMTCNNVENGGEENNNTSSVLVYYERDGVVYDPLGVPQPTSILVDSCQNDDAPPSNNETEIWSPLTPFHSAYDQICRDYFNDARGRNGDDVLNNKFCNADNKVDWSMVEQMIPKCLVSSMNDKNNNNDNDVEEKSCNELSWKIFQEVMGGRHLNCWEFPIAYKYIEIQHHYLPFSDNGDGMNMHIHYGDDDESDALLCNKGQNR